MRPRMTTPYHLSNRPPHPFCILLDHSDEHPQTSTRPSRMNTPRSLAVDLAPNTLSTRLEFLQLVAKLSAPWPRGAARAQCRRACGICSPAPDDESGGRGKPDESSGRGGDKRQPAATNTAASASKTAATTDNSNVIGIGDH